MTPSGLDVALVAMPWQDPSTPSLQLGVIQQLLLDADIQARSFSLYLDFIELIVDVAPDLMSAYMGLSQTGSGVAEWVFADPLRPEGAGDDDAYFDYLRRSFLRDEHIDAAVRLRELVPAYLERCADQVLAAGARVIGFTSTFKQSTPSLALAKLLKQRDPTLTIVFGGSNCEGPMGAALHRGFPFVDVVVRGEADIIAPVLFRELVDGAPVTQQPGLCLRAANGRSIIVDEADAVPVNIDDVPMPTFDDYFERVDASPLAAELRDRVRLPIETSRGCWWGQKSHCKFCGLNGSNMAFRRKSPDRAIAEFFALAEAYQTVNFVAVDNIIDMGYFKSVLPALRDSGFDFRMFYETKANLKREHLELLRAAGVHSIQPGVESLSTPILKLMGKGVSALQNIRLLKWARLYGVTVYWAILGGFPGEDPDEYDRMAELFPALTHLCPPNFFPVRLQRYSPYYERAESFGLEIQGPEEFYQHVYPVDDETLTDIAASFEYRHADGRDPRAYTRRCKLAIADWHESYDEDAIALSYRAGPGFITITDQRPGFGPARYTLRGDEAAIYLATEEGATAAGIRKQLSADGDCELDDASIEDFCGELVEAGLMFEERGRYLALAVPDPEFHRARAFTERAAKADEPVEVPPRQELVQLGRRAA